MTETQFMKTAKEVLIQNVKDAIHVCYTSPEKEDEGYPYATGYARSCLQTVLEYLQTEMSEECAS